MPGATWRDVVAAVLTEKKEAVSLEEIYKEVELYKKAQKINGGRKKFARLFNTIRITFSCWTRTLGPSSKACSVNRKW